MLWVSPCHRKDSEKFSVFGNKKSYIIAQALNSWVTIDLKKVTNLFEISLSIEKKSNLQNFSTKQVCKVKKVQFPRFILRIYRDIRIGIQ